MKRKLAALLALVMVFATCFTAFADTNIVQRYSPKWTKTTEGKWMVLKNNVQQRSTWILDNESDSSEGYYYLLDEEGYVVADQLVVDGHGNYYSFNDQHDGHYGALRTKDGTYNGIELKFSPNHDGTFGAITNKDGIAKLKAKYGVKDMSYITNAKTVKMSDVKYSNAIIDDTPYESGIYSVGFDLDGIKVTEPGKYVSYAADYGDKLKKPATPSDAEGDAIFKGWYMDASREYAFDFENEEYKVESDVVMYAKWASPNYLTFTAGEDNSTITFKWLSGSDVQTSTDGETWTAYTTGTEIKLAKAGDSVKFKGTKVTTDFDNHFVMTGKIAASGSVTSLTDENGADPDVKLEKFACNLMFFGCTSLTSAPELPATTLSVGCYYYMFYNCSLTSAPKLPATTLAKSCYGNMFNGCSLLTSAPELPATTTADECYYYMFQNCKSLTSAPELPAVTLSEGCYSGMFSGCTSLTNAPELPAVTLSTGCYSSMFYGCTSLTKAPKISAATLADYCCYSMFSGCKSLTSAPELQATTTAYDCYCYMFGDCTSLTNAPELPATTLSDECYYYMFAGCKSLTEAPELPATTLANSCYFGMFSSCTSLTSAPALPAETLPFHCCLYMFQGCTSLTSAGTISGKTFGTDSCSYMFLGCSGMKVQEGSGDGLIFAVPSTANAYDALYYMFYGTQGGINSPTAGKSYYYVTTPAPQ